MNSIFRSLDRKRPNWRRWTSGVALLIGGLMLGCGGSPQLGKPRVVDDEEVAPVSIAAKPNSAAPGASAPKPSVTPVTSTVPANPVPSAAPVIRAGPNAAVPTTEVERALAHRKVAAGQIKKIAYALDKYRGQVGRYPDQVLVDREGKWLLSWRVLLLPHLGHGDLYAQFKLDEPWNGPHNLPLAVQIPDVYRSPERGDDKTCIQLITGPKTAYEKPGGLSDRTCPDGLINTVFLADVHPGLAKTWTQPDDYALDAIKVQFDLFTHRLDGALVIFGGDVGPRLLPANVTDDQLLALLTPAGKERVDGEATSRELMNEPYAELVDALRAFPVTRQFANKWSPPVPAAPATASGTAGQVADAGSGHRPSASEPATSARAKPTADPDHPSAIRTTDNKSSADSREPIPTEERLTAASDALRKLYAEDLKAAKKVDERKKFGKKLLDEAQQVSADRPAYYVMLRAARDMAAGAGDLDTALKANRQLIEGFASDEFAVTMKVLDQASPHLTETGELDRLYDEGLRLTTMALDRDDFTGAKQAIRLAQGAARRKGDQDDLEAANRRDDEVNSARLAFQRIAPHLHTLLRTPGDPAASVAVGRYTALVKRDWAKGLALLADGDDAKLSQLAADDLSSPVEHEVQATLGDAWWDWAETATSAIEKSSARLRAVHWYKQAAPGLEPSLPKVRAERRVAEIEKEKDKTKDKSKRRVGYR